ncbi:MAG: DMT family transporter, partial [Desulfotomaculales bacterium]
MGIKLLSLLMAALAGTTMAFQGTINAALGRVLGLVEATFIVHAVGLALAAVLLFILQMGAGGLAKVGEAPWYTYLGGIL